MKAQRAKIAGTIAENTLKKGASKKYAKEVAAYLLENRLTGDLDSILREVQADWAKAGYLEVVAASAHPLTAAIRADITKRAKSLYPSIQKVIITEVIDREVIGSVRLSLP